MIEREKHDENVQEVINEVISRYMKTQEYQELRDTFLWDIDNWCEFLEKKAKEKHGHLSKEESLFWLCFMCEDRVRIDVWLDYCRDKGMVMQQKYAKLSLANLSSMLMDVANSTIPDKNIQQQQELIDILPDHLKTDEAVKIFQRAIDAKMIEKTATGLKWHKTKALLAYLLGHWLKDGLFPETEYDKLFGESRLGKAHNQLMNNKCGDGKPIGYEEIDKLFKEQL